MIEGSRISVTDVATALNTPDGSGQYLRLKNTGAGPVDLGGAGVTSGTGYTLAAAGELDVALVPGDTIFGISAATATNIVEVLVT